MRPLFVALFAACFFSLPLSAAELVDDFSSAESKTRLAERGAWTFENNTATCVADPELYRKFANHGPILKWPHEFNEGTIEFEMKPAECQRVVFTLNGDGHIFRVSLIDATRALTPAQARSQSRVLAWATKSSKQNKGDAIKPRGLPNLPAIGGKWTRVKLTVKGEQAGLQIGDFKTLIDHAALGRDKNMVTLSFASGSLAVRKFRYVSKPEPLASE